MLHALLANIFRSRTDLILENIALRQQLAVLQQPSPRSKISDRFRLFWIALKRFWPNCREPLNHVVVLNDAHFNPTVGSKKVVEVCLAELGRHLNTPPEQAASTIIGSMK